MAYDYNQTNNNQDLAYDLRQYYAKIVGEHLESIANARRNNNYDQYYKSLDDLHTIIRHKFKNTTKDEEEYQTLKTKVLKIANENKSAWFGTSIKQESCSIIDSTLKDIEMFLYDKMEKANMFGSNKKISGL